MRVRAHVQGGTFSGDSCEKRNVLRQTDLSSDYNIVSGSRTIRTLSFNFYLSQVSTLRLVRTQRGPPCRGICVSFHSNDHDVHKVLNLAKVLFARR